MERSHKLAPFEGLRGIAAFIVVIWHLHLAFWITSYPDIAQHLSSLPHFLPWPLLIGIKGLSNGIFAVWLFWIMSAFVLSLQFFLRAHEGTPTRAHDYLEDAFLRRYPRLLIPVLASVAFAYVLHASHLMRNVPAAQALGEPYASGWLGSWYTFPASLSGALKSAAWQSFFAYDGSSTYNNVLWTMEKEFYGSLFLFAFLGVLGHRRSRLWLYPLIALACRELDMDWLNAFVAGIALCDLFVNRHKLSHLHRPWQQPLHRLLLSGYTTAAFWIFLILGAGMPDYRGVFHLLLGVAAIAFTLLSKGTQQFLSSAIPLFLGRISFGLYLIHIPIICSFSCWAYLAGVARMGHVGAALLSSAATCIVSIGCGYLLYIFADRPGIRISRYLSSLIMRQSEAPVRR
ncbi:MAG: acyltransferase [Chthoniobacter sp.]|uniref:acyltransferase family protein n=1 Tax=Chthoniobacter sp. TaxID=2510640 RepID=UPI0032A4BD77